MGETSKQLNMRLKEHEKCLKIIPESSVDLKKLENRSEITLQALETGHNISFEETKTLQKRFSIHKERLTTEAVHIWARMNSLNRKDSIQLATIWQMFVTK